MIVSLDGEDKVQAMSDMPYNELPSIKINVQALCKAMKFVKQHISADIACFPKYTMISSENKGQGVSCNHVFGKESP